MSPRVVARRRALRLVSIAATALAGCGAVSPTAPDARAGAAPGTGNVPVDLPTPPASRGAFWSGAYLGDAATTPEKVGGAIADFAAMTGKRPALVKSFHRLDADLAATGWAGRVLRAISDAGSTNYLALDFDWNGRPAGSLLDAINRGAADAMIDRAARGIATVKGQVLVEAAWEMNGNWAYGWQGIANGSDTQAPAKFVAAWRRVADRFRAAGATNVRWVFNPNTGNPLGAGSSHWNWWGNYYPGDGYVDYIGAHGYNGPKVFGTAYHDYTALFGGADGDYILRDMKARFPNKPIILGEIGAEEVAGHDKGAWVKDAYARMLADPQIVGAVWFNMNKEADWRVNSSPAALAGYRAALQPVQVAEAYDDSRVAPGVMVASR